MTPPLYSRAPLRSLYAHSTHHIQDIRSSNLHQVPPDNFRINFDVNCRGAFTALVVTAQAGACVRSLLVGLQIRGVIHLQHRCLSQVALIKLTCRLWRLGDTGSAFPSRGRSTSSSNSEKDVDPKMPPRSFLMALESALRELTLANRSQDNASIGAG